MKLFISFVDLGVPLNYNFGLRTFPVSAAQIVANGGKIGGIKERWDDPSKPAEFLGSAEEWHHVRPSSGRREREARPSLLHWLSRGVQRIYFNFLRIARHGRHLIDVKLHQNSCAKDSADHNIYLSSFIFSPNFVGLETRTMQQSETFFCFSNFETKQKFGIFTGLIGKLGYS